MILFLNFIHLPAILPDVSPKLMRKAKFKYCEKATKFDEISILVLTLLSNVKTNMEISSNFCGFLRKPQLSTSIAWKTASMPLSEQKIIGTTI